MPRFLWSIWLVALLNACCQVDIPWNSPYVDEDVTGNVVYASFSERPKHLDPARSYSSNEYVFISQIYEPPLQYHFLRRPVELVPQTLVAMPSLTLLDKEGKELPVDTPAIGVAYSEYLLQLRPGIYYQPHPALAQDSNGNYLYHNLTPNQTANIHTLNDLAHTGTREATAFDYAYQITRLSWSHNHCPISGVLKEYIVGFGDTTKTLDSAYAQLQKTTKTTDPYLDLKQFNIQGVQVLDRYQLRIRLNGHYPQFLYWMAMPFFAPIPWEADRFYTQPGLAQRNISLDWYPIGTGPFMLTENNPNLRMVLVRNPNFHTEFYPNDGELTDQTAGLLDDAGKTLPLLDRVIYNLEREDIPYWNKFLQGFYDSSGVSSDSFDQAIAFNAQGQAELTPTMLEHNIQLETAVETSTFYWGFNMLDPVVGGNSERARLLRQAIAIVLDFEEYITIFANGRGMVAQGPIPPGIFGNIPTAYSPYTHELIDGVIKRKSLEVAKQLLATAGYPDGRDKNNGQPLILNYDTVATGPDDKAQLNWVTKQFAKLNIQLVIRATDYGVFQDKMRNGTAQFYRWGWNADYPDPENFLFLLYGANAKVAHDGENASNYDNPEFNQLFVSMKSMSNTPERQQLIDRMVAIVQHDMPWAGGLHPKSFALRHAWVHNIKTNPLANNTLKYRRIDPKLRAEKRQEWNQPITWPLWLIGIISVLIAITALINYQESEQRTAR
ncbi:peptide ABC transporter substrate-binding protein [Achromatium sp. WMS2]|nr:peptide ABC transporter substrate-binding protein [Achromatium sp. WMS2]